MWWWGLVSRRKSVPGLDEAPSRVAWHFKGEGPPAAFSGGSQQALICTHQSCLLTGRL